MKLRECNAARECLNENQVLAAIQRARATGTRGVPVTNSNRPGPEAVATRTTKRAPKRFPSRETLRGASVEDRKAFFDNYAFNRGIRRNSEGEKL